MVKASSIRSVIKGLNTRQKKTMRKHARHHSLRHMRQMASAMKKRSNIRTSTQNRNENW